MRKTNLKHMQEKLLGMKRQILQEISTELRQGREGSKEDGMDTYDLASEERDREISFILNHREREKLQAIEDALSRIEEESFGVCEDCESDIALGRLEALPFTRLCVSCQSEQEKVARGARRFQDDHVYRRLGSTEVEDDSG